MSELKTPEKGIHIDGLTSIGEWITCISTGKRSKTNNRLIVTATNPYYKGVGTIRAWKYQYEGTSVMRK